MNALVSNLPRKRIIAGIFLFWVFVIGTFQVKQYANEKNYRHCMFRDIAPEKGSDWLSRKHSDQIYHIDKKQIKALSRRYNIPKKRVEAHVEAYHEIRKRPIRDSRSIGYSQLAVVDFSKFNNKLYSEVVRVTPKQKKPTMKQKISKNFESTMEFFVGSYFKVMGISFSRKSCKERAR